MKRLIAYLYKKYPHHFWEAMTEEMVGHIPKSIQAPMDDFLKTAGPKWEAWLLHQSWKIQRRASVEAKHHDSYLGMMAFVGWLLHLASRTPVKKSMDVSVPKEKAKKPDEEEGVRDFLTGMLKKE